ncbi:Sin3 histone deacetylase corepressor complex component SDS3 [Spiromyces aspiralis]|uniref:Sin3 histone deacetylase corepressor complex component SDS3 n=1 Tax=Spiromyces aspiralis TaxID=68401 RepID=A0ACC1HJF3_9FUNG|nr:Sin3 histone deacetylase corepressor complex component SDS3 [Spiromyces aspiralis]
MHHQQVQAPAWASTVGPPEDPTTAVQTQRYERRVAHSLRQRVADRLTQIDNEVYQNHERMYQQKYMDIKQAIYLILAGTHPKYVEEVSRLAKKRDDSLVQVESFSRYMLDLYETEMNQILEQANASFEQEKQALYEKMFNNIEERRMRLNEEKDSMELNGSDYFGETGLRPSTKRNLRKRGVDSVAGDSSRSGAAHRRKMTQTFAMVGLSEEEIMKDLSVLRKSTGVTGPLGPGSSTGGKKGSKARKR